MAPSKPVTKRLMAEVSRSGLTSRMGEQFQAAFETAQSRAPFSVSSQPLNTHNLPTPNPFTPGLCPPDGAEEQQAVELRHPLPVTGQRLVLRPLQFHPLTPALGAANEVIRKVLVVVQFLEGL